MTSSRIKTRKTGKPDRRGPGDRRTDKRRRADTLKKQLEAQDRQRSARSSSVGMGPLVFNSELARLHGWTDAEIYKFWEDIVPIYQRVSKRTIKRNPETHKVVHGTHVYTGPVPCRCVGDDVATVMCEVARAAKAWCDAPGTHECSHVPADDELSQALIDAVGRLEKLWAAPVRA